MAIGVEPVDPMSDRPAYQQIADGLRARIAAGALIPGQKLPSETELMRSFGASRPTVRNALDVLKNEGRVRARRGVGVFVPGGDTTPQTVRYVRRSDRFLRTHRAAGRSALQVEGEEQRLQFDQRVVALERVPARADVAQHLRLAPRTRVFARRRLLRVRPGDAVEAAFQPMELADSYYPLDVVDAVPVLREIDTGPGGAYARLEDHGYQLSDFHERVGFRMPTPHEVRRLRLRPGVPVIDIARVAYSGEQPVEYFVGVMAGNRCGLEYRIDIE